MRQGVSISIVHLSNLELSSASWKNTGEQTRYLIEQLQLQERSFEPASTCIVLLNEVT
jgi:hypothetical protein